MFRICILVLLVCSSFIPVPYMPSQVQLHYELYSKRDKIGEIKAIKRTEGNETIFEAETKMTVKVLLKQEIYYHVKAVYKNDILVSSICYTYLNKKLHSTCAVNWKDNHYEIKKDGETTYISYAINYSGAVLYFDEPSAAIPVFSELNGYESAIKHNSEHQFILTDAKTKKQNSYVYKGGILESAYINNALLDIILKRVY